MQVTASREKEEFKPVTVTFVLESEKEVQALYNIFNYTAIVDAVGEDVLNSAAIRDSLKEEYPDAYSATSFSQFIKKVEGWITRRK